MNANHNLKKPSLFSAVKSTVIFIYFITIVLHNLFHISIINYLWYLILVVCFSLGVIHTSYRLSKEIVLFAVLFLFSVSANMYFIGNSSISDIIYTVFYLGVFFLLADEALDERFLEASIYINCVIISVFLLKAGFGNPIFGEISNNYVSVLLLLPASVYYIRREHYLKTISVFPALAIFVTCLLATGRGGILASSLLLLSVVFYLLVLRKDWKHTKKHALFCLIVFSFAAIILAAIPALLNGPMLKSIFQRFSKYGMYGTGRMDIWKEYFTTMGKSTEYIFFGVKFSQLPMMSWYKNNLHNSFLNLHAYYGLFFVLYVIFLIIANSLKCIKEKKWIYFFVMMVFFARSLTDKIYGGGLVATPVLFFLLFYIWRKDSGKNIKFAPGELDNVKHK